MLTREYLLIVCPLQQANTQASNTSERVVCNIISVLKVCYNTCGGGDPKNRYTMYTSNMEETKRARTGKDNNLYTLTHHQQR